MSGFWINGIVMIFLHLAPNLAGFAAAEYSAKHPQAFSKEKQIVSRFLRQGNSSHKAVKRGRHTYPGPIKPTRPIR